MELKHVVIWGLLSFVILSSFLVTAWECNAKKIKILQLLTPMQLFTVGVFIASILIFIPYYYFIYDFGDFCKPLRPFFLSVHNALRMFVVDADFEPIAQMLPLERADGTVTDVTRAVVRIVFSGYCAVLYVVAPILTFTNVLAYFKNIIGAVRYWMIAFKKLYIMSELNEKSIALAESIAEKHRNKKEAGRKSAKAFVIVFTDVFSRNEEENYELMERAMKLGAICLKRDIIHLDIFSKKGDVEVFLIGSDESENTSQAIQITKELNKRNKKQNVKVFAFCSKPGTEHIFNSLQYDNLLNYASEKDFAESTFKLRRINEMRQLIWNTISQMELFSLARRHNNVLSVLIVGFGKYGPEFFKALLWYCQFEGYTLEINIVDGRQKKKDGRCPVRAIIDRISPEIMAKNRFSGNTGEAQYDIEVFSGVDAQTYELDELLYNGDGQRGIRERLKRTNLVFVALGDDDINIATAIHLRSVFDRITGFQAKTNTSENGEPVAIYSVVYDELKSGILKDKNEMKCDADSTKNKQSSLKTDSDQNEHLERPREAERNMQTDGGAPAVHGTKKGTTGPSPAQTDTQTEEKPAKPDALGKEVVGNQENVFSGQGDAAAESSAKNNEAAAQHEARDQKGFNRNHRMDTASSDEQETVRLINYKGVPYNIRFIGGMSSQFNYRNIYDEELEDEAFERHTEWVKHEARVYQEWKDDKDKIRKHSWGFEDWYSVMEELEKDEKKPTKKEPRMLALLKRITVKLRRKAETEEEQAEREKDKKKEEIRQKWNDYKKQERKKYQKFEYFRLSSIAKQLYMDCIAKDEELKKAVTCEKSEPKQTCDCPCCQIRKRSEHMRWNAFVRTMGYIYCEEKRDDRALLHPNLRPWDELDELEKAKD